MCLIIFSELMNKTSSDGNNKDKVFPYFGKAIFSFADKMET